VDEKLEVVVIPVADVDRAKEFYLSLGRRLDADRAEVFHEGAPGGRFSSDGASGRLSGPAPDDASYGSFISFRDPDGNSCLVQEITTRGRVDQAATSAAHGEHEKRIGHADANWPDWYARYMVAEQAGTELPV
jgi:catechol 2,3-dioxygenase-like lactoylglutathione lyase family enzyme